MCACLLPVFAVGIVVSVVTVIVIWIFNTMLRIGLAGENPFEGSPNDVPISNISRGITRDILQIIDEDPANIPEPFENTNHIQM